MPIRVGNKAEGRNFFDRVREREEIWRYLAGNHIVLSGPRRLGKTSLLQCIGEEAEDRRLLARPIDEFTVFLEKLLAKDVAETERLLGWLRAWRLGSGVVCRFVFSSSIGFNALLDRYGISIRFNDC
ncbi:MAG: hypothetical protein LJE70_04470 [Chromatiaceae bacterium]|nr:hypothetical protein [Chromatiaceae bacterium]